MSNVLIIEEVYESGLRLLFCEMRVLAHNAFRLADTTHPLSSPSFLREGETWVELGLSS